MAFGLEMGSLAKWSLWDLVCLEITYLIKLQKAKSHYLSSFKKALTRIIWCYRQYMYIL